MIRGACVKKHVKIWHNANPALRLYSKSVIIIMIVYGDYFDNMPLERRLYVFDSLYLVV